MHDSGISIDEYVTTFNRSWPIQFTTYNPVCVTGSQAADSRDAANLALHPLFTDHVNPTSSSTSTEIDTRTTFAYYVFRSHAPSNRTALGWGLIHIFSIGF